MTTRYTKEEIEALLSGMDDAGVSGASALREYIATLSSVPEDVAREADILERSMGSASRHARDALARLRDWAARVPGLEQRIATMDGALVSLREYVKGVESERDAARQEAATWVRDIVEPVRKALGLDSTITIVAAVASLRERVATLEREKAEANVRTGDAVMDLIARAEAAERRVQEVVTACERLEQQHMESAKGAATEGTRTAYRYAAGAAKVLGAVARDAKPATHPAPAGLLEAVGPKMEELRRNLWSMTYAEPHHVLVSITKAEGQPMLAADDAAKGGERTFTEAEVRHQLERVMPVDVTDLHSDGKAYAVEDIAHGLGISIRLPPGEPEPTVTHAALAAVVEKVRCSPRFRGPDGFAAGSALDEVLRRVTGGQVPESNVSALHKVAQDWLNVLEADGAACTCEPMDTCPLCRVRRALADVPAGEATLPVVRVASAIRAQVHATDASPDWRGGANAVAVALGLTLDTPPSGPGGGNPPESPESSDPRAATLEDFRNGVTQRARIPTPSPEGPALADDHAEHCTMDACKYGDPDCTMRPGPNRAPPEPTASGLRPPSTVEAACNPASNSAPGVAWEHPKGFRVVPYGQGHVVEAQHTDGSWAELDDATPKAAVLCAEELARALAEAKRENATLRTRVSEVEDDLRRQVAASLEAQASATKAAESMRERAAKYHDDAGDKVRAWLDANENRALTATVEAQRHRLETHRQAAISIRALPLE